MVADEVTNEVPALEFWKRHTAVEHPARGTGSLATVCHLSPFSWRNSELGRDVSSGDRKPHMTISRPSGYRNTSENK